MLFLQESLYRIGEKMVSQRKIEETVEAVLKLRSNGLSQQEAANSLRLDRSFISRLESIGELRKGKKVALIGFPLKNKDELINTAQEKGVDYVFVMTEEERWDLVGRQTAMDFFNYIVDLIAELKTYDTVILIGSKKWHKVAEALLDAQVIFFEIGSSPITEDCYLSPAYLETTLDQVLQKDVNPIK